MPSLGLFQSVRLNQSLSPQMQQSLALLQAPSIELRSVIAQELLANPVLEEEIESTSREEERESSLEALAETEESWRDYLGPMEAKVGIPDDADEKRQYFFDSQVVPETLPDFLTRQLRATTGDPEILRVGAEIIGNLDGRGYLRVDLEDLSSLAELSLERVEEALRLVQGLDPAGVAARNLQECLLIQLRRQGKGSEVEAKIVESHLELLARKKFSEIAKLLRVPLPRVAAAARLIRTLQPNPGGSFRRTEREAIVEVDLRVEKIDGKWTVLTNEAAIPRLRISGAYKELLHAGGQDPGLRNYLKEKIRSGRFLLKCLRLRQQTLSEVAAAIVDCQTEFFDHGLSRLRPLTMGEIARRIGIHETTVSRAIANKYVETPHGIFELKYFFRPGYQTAKGDLLSNQTVKAAIEEMVRKEDPGSPLSDQDIVDALRQKGITLARRTVAKYRAALKILPSHLRRSAA
ncbi:RNA polymerase sigma-54 factor [Methylacidimicrobium cyclopophantes]|uniref:RNA polymerase sigma-54 factor n=1 Tax=Methylacidimicrobium cyclopophantes TaxID=1041766 RepID=A0A5E6MR74_9BACT|nr:RNA polymerase factor sigma-54 [Methylacidimicrobium cyclopophantes]VVM08317.1 RNA polymerase sigma-54 factor [Methylacidimicrobium cyclopophantes]